jgi:hypothetical protein
LVATILLALLLEEAAGDDVVAMVRATGRNRVEWHVVDPIPSQEADVGAKVAALRGAHGRPL